MTLSFAPKRSSDRTLYIIRQNFIYIYLFIYIYIYIYVFIYLDREKTKRLCFHPYKPVSWLFTHQGFFFVKNIHDHFMSWRMLALRSPYNSAIIRCNPCLKEKLFHHSINVMNSCPHAGTETKRYCVQLYKALKFTATPIMQICKIYKRWLRIFLTIKSPDE